MVISFDTMDMSLENALNRVEDKKLLKNVM